MIAICCFVLLQQNMERQATGKSMFLILMGKLLGMVNIIRQPQFMKLYQLFFPKAPERNIYGFK
jgi:hypothetical protein